MTLKQARDATPGAPLKARENKNQGAPVQLHTLHYPKYATVWNLFSLRRTWSDGTSNERCFYYLYFRFVTSVRSCICDNKKCRERGSNQ